MTIKNNLKHYRTQTKVVKQVDIAHFMDHSNSVLISNYESGKKAPNLKACITYALVLDVPLSKLIPVFYTTFIKTVYTKTKELIQRISSEPFSFEKEKRLTYFNAMLERISCLQPIHDDNQQTTTNQNKKK